MFRAGLEREAGFKVVLWRVGGTEKSRHCSSRESRRRGEIEPRAGVG